MPLEKIVMDFLIKECRTAQKNIARDSFFGVMNLGEKMEVMADLYPDEVWSKEFVLNAIVLQTLAATAEHHYKQHTNEDKNKIKEVFNEAIEGIVDGISATDPDKVHKAIGKLAYEIHLILTGEV